MEIKPRCSPCTGSPGDVPVRGQVAEGELQGVIQARGGGLLRHAQPVVGDADKPDLPLALGLLHGLAQAGAVAGLGAEGRVMELVHVDVVSLEQAQAGLQILPEASTVVEGVLVAMMMFPRTPERARPIFSFAVGVGTGGVEIGDAGVVGFAQEHPGVVGGDTLDGQSAKAVLVHSDAGAAQGDSLHTSTSFLKKIEGKTGTPAKGKVLRRRVPVGQPASETGFFKMPRPKKRCSRIKL